MSDLRSPTRLQSLYRSRFANMNDYRSRVWHILAKFFEQWISPGDSVLDLGCGRCEFINNVRCAQKIGMDLNPDAAIYAASDVRLIRADCANPWPVTGLDCVFTSNFFEHLPTKAALMRTLQSIYSALQPGGRLIAMGPNIRFIAGAYWDFFDHFIALSDLSLCEALRMAGFTIERSIPRFLPYTMSHGRRYPLQLLRTYLALPPLWLLFGKQFLVIASKPKEPSTESPDTTPR